MSRDLGPDTRRRIDSWIHHYWTFHNTTPDSLMWFVATHIDRKMRIDTKIKVMLYSEGFRDYDMRTDNSLKDICVTIST